MYDPKITAEKAAGAGAAAGIGAGGSLWLAMLLVASLRTKGVATWPEALDEVAVALVATVFTAVVAGVIRAFNNYAKHNWGLLIVAGLCLVGLSGCETLTLTDGTVVQRLDTTALKEAYGIYLLEEERRAREGRPGTAVEVTVDGVEVDIEAVKEELRDRGIQVRMD